MSKQIQAGALQVDADVCNALDTPARGCHAGAGVHVDIPVDWLTRILAGQQVPGCNYHALFGPLGDSLFVSDKVIAQLAIPALVNALAAPLKAEAPLLTIKLSTAAVVSAQLETP